MARVFSGATDTLRANWSRPGGWADMTVALWFRADSLHTGWMHSHWHNGGGSYYTGLYVSSDGTVTARWRGADTHNRVSSNTYSAETWHHVAGSWGYKRVYDVWLDGVGVTGDSYSNGAQPNVISFGNYVTGSSVFDGKIAWPAIWDVKLEASDYAALSSGVSPLLVRPDNLVYFQPLGGLYGDHDYDIVGKAHVTAYYGAPTYDTDAPPGLIHPVLPQFGTGAGGGGGGGGGGGSWSASATRSTLLFPRTSLRVG